MPELRAEVFSPERLPAADAREWERLCAGRAEFASPFFTPGFSRAVAAVRGGVRVCVLRLDDRPVGFLPFQFPTAAHRVFRAAEPVGGGMSDYFGLIAEPEVRISGARLAALAGLSHLGFTHLPHTQLERGLEGEKPEPGLRIVFERGNERYWDELRTTRKRFVEDTMRRERQLAAEVGPVRFVFHDPSPRALESLIERKRSQYRRTNAPDSLAAGWKRMLLRRLLDSQDPACRGVLSTLHAGDTWVASHFGLRGGSGLHYWFPVYNLDLQRFSPGRLLIRQIIDSAAETGLRSIDRGAGDSQAKRDFANARQTYYRGAWFRPGAASTAYRAACSIGWRLQPWRKLRWSAR